MTLMHKFALAVALSLPFALFGQNGVLVTVAGNGTVGTSGVGGPAVNASIYPSAVCVDAAGNIYIADGEYNRVVEVNTSGILNLIAGTGAASSTGNNGLAMQATLNGPAGIAIDAAGNLYIAEAAGNRVRRVNLASGIIITFAGNGTATYAGDGGPAASASLNMPRGLAVDAGGNLFIADLLNFRVRRVDAVSGNITTVAGTGTNGQSPDGTPALSANLAGPMAVSFDAQGNLLIGELFGYDIRRVTTSTGLLSTVAGNGGTVFNGDGEAATSAALGYMGSNVAVDSGGSLYFADSTGRVRRVDAVTGIITTVAGNGTGAHGQTSSGGGGGGGTPTCPSGLGLNGPATVATLDGPAGVAFTSGGELIIADSLDCLVAGVQLPSPLLYTTTAFSLSGQTLTVTVTPINGNSTPTGTVQFAEYSSFGPALPLATATLGGGIATLSLGSLPAGSYPVMAIYQGDSNYNGSGSASLNVTGTGKPTPSASANVPYPVVASTPVTIGFNVVGSGSTSTGTVQLSEGSTLLATVTLVNGAGSFSYTASTSGKHQITLQYPGDNNYNSLTWNFSVSVLVASTLTLTADTNPANTGATVNLAATVSPTSGTGTVSFYDNSNLLGAAAVANGAAAFVYSTTLPGTHSLTATYSGDTVVAPATSNVLSETINTTATSVAVTTSASTITFGQSLTFTAAITPVRSTGSVEFYDGTTQLGGATVVTGSAQLIVPQLGAGSHSITAQFAGTQGYAGSTSPAVSETVNVATPVVTVTSGANPVLSPASVTFTANMTPSWNGSSLQIVDGGKLLAGGSAPTGTFSLTIALSPGIHSITAVCPGDANLNPATSATLSETVKANSTMALSLSASTISYSQPVTFTATLTPSAASGSVQFTDAGTAIGSAPIASGVAALTVTTLAAGSHSIQAVYGGDGVYLASNSTASALTVNKAATQVNLASSPNPATTVQSVALTATLSPSAATGSVQFLDGTNVLGTAAVTGGTATLSAAPLSAASHSLTVSYLGDSNCSPAASATVSETVNKAASTASLSVDNPSIAYGQTVNFTASVSPAAATGTVQFVDGSTVLATLAVSNGSVPVLPAPNLAAGAHSVTAVYSGDSTYASNSSAAVTVTVAKANPSIGLSPSVNPAVSGQGVNLTATLLPAGATGTVQFLDNGNAIAPAVAISGGAATLANVGLSVGSHPLTAVYSGDANCNPVTSTVLTETVNKAPTTTTLSESTGSITVGQSVTLTASVAPSYVGGTVQFLDGGTALGTASLTSGSASFTAALSTAGTHTITAVYSGDSNDLGSTSTAVTVTVAKAASTVAVAASPNPSSSGQTVTFTATVSPSAATGSVQFLDGSASLGTATLSGGTASLSTAALAAGNHSITAVYSGDSNYNGSTSAVLSQTVTKAATTTALSTSSSSITYGQSVTLTAAVTPASATGTVQFLNGSTVLGTATLSNGAASFVAANLAVGSQSLTAVYSGDANDNSSTSAAVMVTLAKVSSATALSASPTSITYGQSVTLTAAVTPAAATGTVQFLDGPTVLGTATLSSGTASFVAANLAAGSQSLTALYSGDANNSSSTSAAVVVSVGKTSASVTVASSLNPSVAGRAVTFTATVSPSAATGTVQFLDGSTSLGTITLSGGTASLSTSSLAAGAQSITAVYSGSANYNGATSSALTESVLIATTTAISASKTTASEGQTVAFTATVTPTAATGAVQFLDGTTVIGTANLSSGSAALSSSTLAIGSHSITASYSGSSTYAASSSAAVVVTIVAALPPSNLTATAASSSQINLAWTASATSGVTYNVYASSTSGFTPSTSNRIASGVTSTSYSQTGLSAGATMYYLITAQDSYGASSSSNQASATTPGSLSCHVVYTITTQWNVGFGTAISIQNTGSSPINNWQMTWTWPGNQEITESWNATYSQTGQNANLTYESYNATIAAGSTLSGIGFNGSYSGSNPSPTAFYVNGTLCH
jgi:large repetitive protein